MSFKRKRKRILKYEKNLLLKCGVGLISFWMFIIIIGLSLPQKFIDVLIASLIAFISFIIIALLDFEREKAKTEEMKKIYCRAENDLKKSLIKLYSFLRIPREVYLNVKKETPVKTFYQEFYKKFNKSLDNFIQDKKPDYTEVIREEITKNLEDSLIIKWSNYDLRKTMLSSIFDKIINSPYFVNLYYEDQEEIFNLRELVKQLIEQIDEAVNKNDEERIKTARGDTLMVSVFLRRIVLSWYVIYCKANYLQPLSWNEIKTALDDFTHVLDNPL